MEELINETILGGYGFIDVLGYIWFFLIGFAIYGLNETSERDVQSKNTPKEWSWKFWANDNWKRYIVTILTTYIMFRFYVEMVGHEFSNFEALMMGMIGDGVGAKLKKKVNRRKKLLDKDFN